MKKIVTLMLAAGLVFGAFSTASAAQINAKGSWDFAFEFNDNSNFYNAGNGDTFYGEQRFRTQIDVIASEALRGVVFFEIGETVWGSKDGALGADGKVVEVRRSYIDWLVPNTDLKVRMGIQGIALPGAVTGSSVLDDDMAAITLSYTFNDNIAATAFWARPYDFGNGDGKGNKMDEMDMFGLVLPMSFDGVKVTPYGLFANIGKDVYSNLASYPDGYNGGSIGSFIGGMLPPTLTEVSTPVRDDLQAWWGGASVELSTFDPLSVKLDATYGKVTTDEAEYDRAGWLVSAAVDYKLNGVTPGIVGWYGTGEDGDAANGSEQMPYIYSSAWGPTSLGFAGTCAIGTDSLIAFNGAGTWGAELRFADISFVENLSHVVRFAYIGGTNDPQAGVDATFYPTYMTTEDKAFEINFDSTYQIYENLTLIVEMGWLRLDRDEDVWGKFAETEHATKLGFNLNYSF